MNVLKKITEVRGYDAIFAKQREIEDENRKRITAIESEICDRIVNLCKDPKYVEFVINQFRNDSFDVFLSIAQMNMMIKALDNKSSVIATDDINGEELFYGYDPDTYPELARHTESIKDIMAEGFNENPVCDSTNWCLYTAKNNKSKYLYMSVIESDYEYLDDYEFRENFVINTVYERAIRAVHQLYKDNIETIGEMMDNNLEQ